jgi:hypothetical protein
MEDSGFYRAVGFILALLFAIVFGLCIFAILYSDFALSGGTVNDRERTTLQIAATAGATAALLSWVLQKYAAHRGFGIRVIYGLLIYLLLFAAIGGMLELGYGITTNTGTIDFSLSGLYFLSYGAFATFAINLIGAQALWIVGLIIFAGLFLGAVGPRKIY